MEIFLWVLGIGITMGMLLPLLDDSWRSFVILLLCFVGWPLILGSMLTIRHKQIVEILNRK